MCCQICDWKSTAPSSGHFRQPTPTPPPPKASALGLTQLKKESYFYRSNLFMYFFLYFSFLSKSLILTIVKQFKHLFSIRKMCLKYLSVIYSFFQTSMSLVIKKKIPHIGDKASLYRCRQQHQCQKRVVKEYSKTLFF